LYAVGPKPVERGKEPHSFWAKAASTPWIFKARLKRSSNRWSKSHSATAHFELGWLYDEKNSEPPRRFFIISSI